jgi:hypothetical protein
MSVIQEKRGCVHRVGVSVKFRSTLAKGSEAGGP